jgi:SpoVK/Ycf46/Vps4 family AAA+-type ATPase
MVKMIKSELYVDQSELQNTSWDDIAGLKEAKQKLQEAAILPLARPDLFTGLRKPRNIILYGPPGTGKTMLVKAVARESQCLLFICTASSLTSKWHGEGEKLLRTLFQVARAAAPSIIFVDEMDALLSSRKSDGEHEASRRFKTEFMTQVDGIVKDGGASDNGKHLLLIACTNCPWDIDSAVLRRFPTRIYIPLPDRDTRKALLEKILPKAGEHKLNSSDIKTIAKRLNGFSGSDISSIASEASFGPIRSLGSMEAIRGAKEKDIRPISVQDFESAIDQATKSVSKDLLKKYDEWKKDQAAS